MGGRVRERRVRVSGEFREVLASETRTHVELGPDGRQEKRFLSEKAAGSW